MNIDSLNAAYQAAAAEANKNATAAARKRALAYKLSKTRRRKPGAAEALARERNKRLTEANKPLYRIHNLTIDEVIRNISEVQGNPQIRLGDGLLSVPVPQEFLAQFTLEGGSAKNGRGEYDDSSYSGALALRFGCGDYALILTSSTGFISWEKTPELCEAEDINRDIAAAVGGRLLGWRQVGGGADNETHYLRVETTRGEIQARFDFPPEDEEDEYDYGSAEMLWMPIIIRRGAALQAHEEKLAAEKAAREAPAAALAEEVKKLIAAEAPGIPLSIKIYSNFDGVKAKNGDKFFLFKIYAEIGGKQFKIFEAPAHCCVDINGARQSAEHLLDRIAVHWQNCLAADRSLFRKEHTGGSRRHPEYQYFCGDKEITCLRDVAQAVKQAEAARS